ncbi:MAG TPA: LPS export ABC transporter permease LptF [Desulfobulbaceae bacterium]|nr:LPS export ABC transporter permease LptF [Desulfobulbaceae bacterium]
MTRPSILPLLLYSYIATEMLAPFFASFLILYSVFFLIRLMPLLDIVLELRIGFADFIRLFCYIFPHMLLYVIPMASMAGVIIGFTRLTNEREILVLKSCGVSLRQLLPPVLVLSLAISALTGLFSVQLIPAGDIAMKQLMFQLAKEKIDKGLQARTFSEALGDLVVYVDEIDAQNRWHGVYVSDKRNRLQPIIIMAEGGHLDAEIDRMLVTVVLEKGTLHNAEGKENQVIRFQRYQMQIPLMPPTRIGGDDVTVISRGSMTQDQLLRAAKKYGPDTRHGVVFLTEYYDRLILPVGCFILSLLGFPLGMQTGPGRRATGIPLGLFFFILYYVLYTAGRLLSENLLVPTLVGMWLPSVLFAALTLYVFRRVERERTIIPERLLNLILDLLDNYIFPFFRWTRKFFMRCLHRHQQEYIPYQDKAAPDGMQVHASIEDRIYHLPGCELYDSPRCNLKFKDAKVAVEAGFKPCRLCNDS